MSKRPKGKRTDKGGRPTGRPSSPRLKFLLSAVLLAAVVVVVFWLNHRNQANLSGKAPLPTNALTAETKATDLPTNEVAQSLMVVVELDFGARPPSIEDALKEVERRSEPFDGTGRTFAVLDADGNISTNGKLRIQMHLSMEKPGVGALNFRRTGEVLWKSRIAAAPTGPPPPKQLTVIMDDAEGKSVMLDGSKGAAHVLDVPLRNATTRVRDVWPDGAVHQFTFIYSVCGCPVKTMVRRSGEGTARTSDLPVMFPDDPAAMETIRQLMGWTTPK